jgi:TRAP-type C4-dicarboxylate transport system permease small subunit
MSFVDKASTALQRCDQVLRAIEKAGVAVAGLLMFMIMLVVVTDVVARYFFNSPLEWSYELISLYLMVGLFFFALSDTLANNAHVAVDILHLYMPERIRHAAEFVGYLLATPVFAAIFYMALLNTLDAYKGGDVLAGHIPWPTWLSSICVPIGVGVTVLRMAYRAVGHALSFAAGRSIIALPPVSGMEEAEAI